MKKYILNRDVGDFNKGEVFSDSFSRGFEHHEGTMTATFRKASGRIGKIVDEDLFQTWICLGWLDEVKESKGKWRPGYKDTYWFVTSVGQVQRDYWAGSPSSQVDIDRYELGNCFQTEEEAQPFAEKFKELFVKK